jgi:hypothetical protein
MFRLPLPVCTIAGQKLCFASAAQRYAVRYGLCMRVFYVCRCAAKGGKRCCRVTSEKRKAQCVFVFAAASA